MKSFILLVKYCVSLAIGPQTVTVVLSSSNFFILSLINLLLISLKPTDPVTDTATSFATLMKTLNCVKIAINSYNGNNGRDRQGSGIHL